MGKGANRRQNAQRKTRAREWARRKARAQSGHQQPIEVLVNSAVHSSASRDGRPRSPEPGLLENLADRHELSAAVLARELLVAVNQVWHRHWQPADVPRALAHTCGTAHAQLGAEAVLRELRTHQPGSLPPRWDAQMDAIDPGTDSLDLSGAAEDPKWAAPCHHLLERRLRSLAVAVETLAFLRGLPRLPKIGPLPGEPTQPSAPGAAHVDPSVLHRVTSLLAKAESTSFPKEADALTAKAQELMARHAVDMASIEARREGPATPVVARRIGIDDPYASPKAVLLHTIASANRCKSVWSKDFAFATVFGDETDLDTVELLYTSLLVQSARAMIAASPPGRSSGGRTRSFRQSFLVSFAHRIGHRLREAVATAVRAAEDEEGQGSLLPVLASRESAAREACQAAFPSTRTTSSAANDTEGWQAGRRAADRAQLDLNDTVGQGQGRQAMAMALETGRA